MSASILDGKALAAKIRRELTVKVDQSLQAGMRAPGLRVRIRRARST